MARTKLGSSTPKFPGRTGAVVEKKSTATGRTISRTAVPVKQISGEEFKKAGRRK